jgi:hypothetical protein
MLGHSARFIVANPRMVAIILLGNSKRVKSTKSDFFISRHGLGLREELNGVR